VNVVHLAHAVACITKCFGGSVADSGLPLCDVTLRLELNQPSSRVSANMALQLNDVQPGLKAGEPQGLVDVHFLLQEARHQTCVLLRARP